MPDASHPGVAGASNTPEADIERVKERKEMDAKKRKIWLEAEKNLHSEGGGEAAGWRPRIYGDTPSFMEVPIAYTPEDLASADAVFIGFPWEGLQQIDSSTFAETGPRPPDPDAIIARSGAYQAPEYIRKYSVHYSLAISGGFFPEEGETFRLVDHLTIMDYRDVEVKLWDVEETSRRAIEKVGDIVKAGAVPLVFGGDHATPYPIVKAISDHSDGKIGVINFDSHYDIGLSGRLNAENAFGKIMDNCRADPENLAIIGIRGGSYNTPGMHKLAKDLGVSLYTNADVRRLGIEAVVRKAIEAAGRGTDKIYVSLDADSMDAVSFPAQKYPDPLGLSAHEIEASLRILSREANLCGVDLVCVGPAYDHKGVGALTACRYFIEVLKGLAVRKRASGARSKS
jgi:arginase family enzyme